MISKLKNSFLIALAFLGDAAHRRAVSALIVVAALQISGAVFDIEHVDTLLTFLIPVAAAWSSRTPKLPDPETTEESD